MASAVTFGGSALFPGVHRFQEKTERQPMRTRGYPGVNGVEIQWSGRREQTFVLSGYLETETTSLINAAIVAIRDKEDGEARTLVDSYGNTTADCVMHGFTETSERVGVSGYARVHFQVEFTRAGPP